MDFWLSKHTRRVGGRRKKLFVEMDRNVLFQGCQSRYDGVAMGGGGIPGELLVGVGISKKLVYIMPLLQKSNLHLQKPVLATLGLNESWTISSLTGSKFSFSLKICLVCLLLQLFARR